MTTITLEIPKEIENRIVDAYVNWHGHDGKSDKVQFMTIKIYEHIMEMVGHYETEQATIVTKVQIEEQQKQIEKSRKLILKEIAAISNNIKHCPLITK